MSEDNQSATQEIRFLKEIVEDLRRKGEEQEKRIASLEIAKAETVIYYKTIIDKIDDHVKNFAVFKLNTESHREDVKKEIQSIRADFQNKSAVVEAPKKILLHEIAKLAAAGVISAVLLAIIAYALTHGAAIAPFIHNP